MIQKLGTFLCGVVLVALLLMAVLNVRKVAVNRMCTTIIGNFEKAGEKARLAPAGELARAAAQISNSGVPVESSRLAQIVAGMSIDAIVRKYGDPELIVSSDEVPALGADNEGLVAALFNGRTVAVLLNENMAVERIIAWNQPLTR